MYGSHFPNTITILIQQRILIQVRYIQTYACSICWLTRLHGSQNLNISFRVIYIVQDIYNILWLLFFAMLAGDLISIKSKFSSFWLLYMHDIPVSARAYFPHTISHRQIFTDEFYIIHFGSIIKLQLPTVPLNVLNEENKFWELYIITESTLYSL